MGDAELRQKTCCFTGHRRLPPGCIEKIRERTARTIRELICSEGVRYFGVGGALGFDTLAAEVLFQLREEEFPGIRVILVYPFEGFTDCWPESQREAYRCRLSLYDKRVCVSGQAGRWTYLARNRHLVDHSAFCIAYCVQQRGGTVYTLDYAQRQGLSVRNIADASDRTG